MSRPKPADFYSTLDSAPQQGDILLGAVARVVATDDFAPPRWSALDEAHAGVLPAEQLGEVGMPELRVAAGRALVMITTHDCGMDKEFNHVVDELLSAGSAMTEATAMLTAEGRTDLDRGFQVSPLVAPTSVTIAGSVVDQGLLMAGRLVGYLPVPELVVNGTVVIPPSVVDLSYRSTLDRLAYTRRVASVSETARERLRYALTKLDVLRTPSLESQLSQAVGQTILTAKVHKKNPLVVRLTLEDHSVLELLLKPGSPGPGPISRTRRSLP